MTGDLRQATGAAALPDDPDLEAAETPAGAPRPVHLRPGHLLLVAAGGALGTAARAALAEAFPPVDGVPYTILAINVGGAFLLGMLLDLLARRGPDRGRRRTLRLLIGTGFLGGFTTYSALAADSAVLIGHGMAGAGIGYALATLFIGAGMTWAGMAVGGLLHRTRERRRA